MIKTIVSFMIGVASSLFASYLLYCYGLFAKFIPPKFRKSFDREYKNQHKALKSIRKDAMTSNTLKVVAMKGDTFSNPESGDLRDLLINGPHEQKYLISDPNNQYVETRGRELNNQALKSGIENSIHCFKDAIKTNPNKSIKLHNEILRFRLIIFDSCLYLSFQSTDTPGRKSPMQRYVKNSSGYLALEAFFNDLWNKY